MASDVSDDLRVSRRHRIEAALSQYPDIDAEELAELLHWFHKEASALDVGLVASDPQLQKPYQQLRADHLDRIRGADLFWIAVAVLAGGCALALTVWATL